ncbi:protein polybromo-1 isoform X3 [Folsomia candida]|uniref:protein polybromo-1 isoform X3 n=1 Tax=Folsomia candida TaxID=158441 RepID=UPI000B90893B|nr:protein polybromo-1 isoform X3 [Folsomia candida]
MFSGAGAASSKRRRTSMSSSASKEDETGEDLDYHDATSKRKRMMKLDPIEQCQHLYDIMRNHKKEDGTLLCEPFIRVPKRRQEPLYYEVVSNPMDMLRIQQKIKMDEYEDVDQMGLDFDLMLTNAKAFYKRSTPEYKDACDLWDLFGEHKCRLFDDASADGEGKGKIILKMGKLARRAAAAEARKPAIGGGGDDEETSESSSTTTDKDRHEDEKGDNVLFNQLEDLFTAIINAKDVDDRPLHTVFQLLPSRKKYPSYYEVTENPIDLKMIAMKIQQVEYTCLSEMEKDLLLMARNACAFNEPGSQIYKDAKTLKKVVASKKYEIEHGKPGTSTPGKSERIRNRRLRSGTSHSAVTAALQYEDDDEEEEDEEAEEESDDDEEHVEDEEEEEDEEEDAQGNIEDPMWALYEAVSTCVNPAGTLLAEPFKRLPSRRFYPDYYNEIKNPISLAQIKTRILRNEYVNLTQVQADLNVMFENAKAYNIPDSHLYKSAVKLQKLVHNKVQELLGPDGDESSNDDVIIPKRSATNTPIPTLSLEGDMIMDVVDEDEQGRSKVTNIKRSSGKSKTKDSLGSGGAQVVATTVPPSKSSPTKVEEKNLKTLAYREQLKKRFLVLYQVISDYTEPDGRSLISPFMEKPSRKMYPDYYSVINEPIDMISIKANIELEKYNSTDEIMKDFVLMFNNCRIYNEEGSLIYEDANKLEKVLRERARQLGADPTKPKLKKKKNPQMLLNQKKLLETVREHKDKNGRLLSAIFQKLPSKAEYPEYYEIIKNPIDLERIGNKQRNGTYETLEQISGDLMLMFDNACKFNEPDSSIYKDALILQRLVLQTKMSIVADDDGVPDVRAAVKEILISIFTSVYNHQDEEGRCFTDTMAELPEYDEADGTKIRAISLDLIKSRLDRGYYKRLDLFQRDMFLGFERARKLSRSDSQVFEDSVELQSFFIRTRDEMCGENGEILQSPALAYKLADFERSVETLRVEKKAQELPQDEDIPIVEKKDEAVESQSSQSESYNEQTFSIGDFVYVTPTPPAMDNSSSDGSTASATSKSTVQPHIANIQKLWTAPDGIKWFEGIWFYRPDQTYHVPTRKFLEKEVFRSEVRTTAMLSEIIGKCWVMTVKGREYFHYAPEGYADEDVYVCEYRYSTKARSFCKLKSWAFDSDRVKLIPRPKPLEPVRVASVFKERFEKHRDELQQLDDSDKAPPELYPNIELPLVVGKEGLRYYEQFSLSCGPIRSGDFVLVRVASSSSSENAKKLVARVDSMWADAIGTTFFHGPWFTSLSEISPANVPQGRVFYKNEIFQSSIEDTNPLLSICGKCCVLDLDEYIKMRPTEVPETDVYVCESLYDEARRQVKKFEGLKKYQYMDPRVHRDELFMFRRPITLAKVDLDGSVIPAGPEMPRLKAAMKVEPLMAGIKLELDSLMDDSLESPPSIGSNSETTGSVIGIPIGPMTPSGTTKKQSNKTGKKLVTGYILYSSEVRRGITERNSTSSFGEISRMVGQEWKKLPRSEKQKYEERAAKMNEEKEAAIAKGIDPGTIGPGSQRFKENASKQAAADSEFVAAAAALKRDPDWIFECVWDGCEWQFEDALDLIEHCVQEPKGHVPSFFKDSNDTHFQCKWTNCARIKKTVKSFPTLNRLLKHVREIHILKGNGRIIHPEMRSKLFRASRNPKPRPAAVATMHTPSIPHGPSGLQQSNIVINAGMQQSNVLLPAPSPTLGTIVGASGVGQVMPQMQPQVIVRAGPPPEPLFVTVPPRPQKLLHSEAYIRYIESLHSNKKPEWDKTLHASKETVKTDEDKLPSQWLGNGAGAHTSVTDALWALRDFMMRDCLNLSKNIHFKNF